MADPIDWRVGAGLFIISVIYRYRAWDGRVAVFNRDLHLHHHPGGLRAHCPPHRSSEGALPPRVDRRHPDGSACGRLRQGLEGEITFNNEIFFAIILPPIIFSAGYSLRKSLFFEHFGMISFLGVIGTIIGFIVICLLIYLLNRFVFSNTLSLKELMQLAAVLCATDTVAAMSLIKPEKYPVLNAVLFGEGILNDAVAIVLFRTVGGLELDENNGITIQVVLWMVFDFLVLTFFSLAIGAAFGFGLSYLFKINESFNRYPIKQTSLILLVGYISYLVGELLGFSGIITLFTCAIIMGHYAFMNISEESQRGTGLAFQTVSYIAEAFVYAYLGASLLGVTGKGLAVGFAALILLFFPIIRGAMVYILPGIYYLRKRAFPLKKEELKVVWYSGMVRGVIAFALTLQVESENEDFIVTIVLFTVLITTILGSSLLKSFCDLIGLKEQVSNKIDAHGQLSRSLIEYSDYRAPQFDLESGNEGGGDKRQELEKDTIRQKLSHFENQYMKPLFKKANSEKFNYDIEISEVTPELEKRSVA